MAFSPIEDVLADLRAGKMIVLTDDERRENEGDLVLPAQFVTPEAITFMLKEAKGYLCLSLTEGDCDRLALHPQAGHNTSVRGTAFTVSIDGHPRHGFGTGVSARERARCIQMAIDPRTAPDDFVRPGHINPLRSRDGGVLVRTGQTEGSVDLCRLAGLTPAACIIEIMRDDGEMARVPDLVEFCRRHGVKMCSVAQIIEHRLTRESMVRRVGPAEGRTIRTALGEFNVVMYESLVDPLPHVALTVGDVGRGLAPDARPTLVRMHRRHLLGDVFGDLSTGGGGGESSGSSGDVLRASMAAIQKEGRGAIVYLRTSAQMDSADLGDLETRLQALRRGDARAGVPDEVAEAGGQTRRAEERGTQGTVTQRDFGVGGQILRDLGLTRLRLLTNSTREMPGLEAFGISIVERVAVG